MNKPLVERINEVFDDITAVDASQEWASERDEILADVRELVEAAQQFRCEFSPAIAKDETVSYCFTVGQYNRLSEILRKVGGDIGTAPSLPAGEPQNSAVKVPDGLIEALHRQRQVDEDGSECGVSRQAVEETISILQSLTHPTETPR